MGSGGLKFAWEAFVKKHAPDDSEKRLFFVAMGQTWCGSRRRALGVGVGRRRRALGVGRRAWYRVTAKSASSLSP